jgi:hypothetical protein
MPKNERIEIETNKEEYNAGENIYVKVFFHLEKPVKARAVKAALNCHEKKKTYIYTSIPPDEVRRIKELGMEVTSPIKKVEQYEESNIHHEEHGIGGAGEYEEQKFEFFFTLPKDAQPTSYEMGHDDKTHAWHLRIKIDIPFAPDINAEKDIMVAGLA